MEIFTIHELRECYTRYVSLYNSFSRQDAIINYIILLFESLLFFLLELFESSLIRKYHRSSISASPLDSKHEILIRHDLLCRLAVDESVRPSV